MTTYFITGGYGFLGQYIVQAIHQHDAQASLRVLVRSPRQTYLKLDELTRVTWVQGELTQPASFTHHLYGVDVVIHNAAMVAFSPAKSQQIFNANVLGTRHLAHAARAAGCRRFIFISSISAMDFRPPLVTDETFLPDLEAKKRHDIYGYTKRLSEIELQAMKDEMQVIILNPSVILGPGSDRVALTIRIARKFPLLPMMDYTNAFVDVRDVAAAVALAVNQGSSGERYLVSAHNASMLDFTRAVVQSLGKKTPVIPMPLMGLRMADRLVALLDRLRLNPGIRRPSQMNIDKPCSHQKISAEMGWQPQYALAQSIADSVRWANNP